MVEADGKVGVVDNVASEDGSNGDGVLEGIGDIGTAGLSSMLHKTVLM